MPFLTYLAMPSASAILTETASSSQTLFSEFFPLALFGAGFIIGGIIVYAIISWLIGGIQNIIGERNFRNGTASKSVMNGRTYYD